MNKKFLEFYMMTKPEDEQQKYMFIVDNQDVAYSLINNGNTVLILMNGQDAYHTEASFIEYMDKISCTGTYQTDYIYVPSCSTKKTNEILENYFRDNHLMWKQGWQLFKCKEYLSKPEYADELKRIISDFVYRHEGPTVTNNLNLDKFHHFNSNGKITGVFDIEIVDQIIRTVPFFTLENTPYIYDNGYYYKDEDGANLKLHIQNLIYRQFVSATTINRVYELLIMQPQIKKTFYDINNQPAHWINFQNGFFDPLEWTMIPHDPQYLSINQIPHEFNPEVSEQVLNNGQHIDKYLNFALPNHDDQTTFWEYLGYCMTTDTCYQKFVMLLGNGGTGKSLAISLYQNIVGHKNCSNISLQKLNERFYATGLFGKLLNACADIPSATMRDSDTTKKAVGEDSLIYEKKGKDHKEFNSYSKLIFSGNKMPKNLDDSTNAFFRRLLILKFDCIVPKSQLDLHLKDKICKESDYAICKAMQALQQLYIGGKFTESISSKRYIEHLYRSTNSANAFANEELVHLPGNKIKRSTIYHIYEEYCNQYSLTTQGKSDFWECMADRGYFFKRFSDGHFYFKDTAVKESEFVTLEEDDESPFK